MHFDSIVTFISLCFFFLKNRLFAAAQHLAVVTIFTYEQPSSTTDSCSIEPQPYFNWKFSNNLFSFHRIQWSSLYQISWGGHNLHRPHNDCQHCLLYQTSTQAIMFGFLIIKRLLFNTAIFFSPVFLLFFSSLKLPLAKAKKQFIWWKYESHFFPCKKKKKKCMR